MMLLLSTTPTMVSAEVVPGLYGTPGLIDMPTAETMDDGTISLGLARLPESLRFTSSFQILPSVNLTFRYSGIGDLEGYAESSGYSLWDRSLDLSARLWSEGRWMPAVSVGARDIMGTGVMASEYLVATKTLTPDISVTAGLGWGRLATGNQIARMGTRPDREGGDLGGRVRLESLFRGDVGLFGGVRWQTPWEGLSVAVEYSSDDYSAEGPFGVSPAKTPWSIGLNWKPRPDLNIGLAAMNGRGIAFNLTAILNPRGQDLVPKPEWTPPANRSDIAETLAGSGVVPLAYGELRDACRLDVSASGVRSAAVAVDRAGRALAMEGCDNASVRVVREDMALSEIRLDLSGPEPKIVSVGPATGSVATDALRQPAFEWDIAPLVRFSLFDPDHPLYHDLSVAVQGSYRIAPGLKLAGQLSKTVTGDFEEMTRGTKGSLPHVRTETYRYAQETGFRLDYLTLDLFHQHNAHVFSHLSLGYLESQYAGVSAEIYARHPTWPLAIGAELNLVQARDFDQQFGLRNLDGLAKVNGHASIYWDTGFHDIDVQLDAGRYLAGDLGATLSVSRNFENGWEVGAFATITDASSDEFGEGSFDKGVFFRIPVAFFSPRETGMSAEARVSSLTGDGGQRVSIRNRLHGIVSRGEPSTLSLGCSKSASCF